VDLEITTTRSVHDDLKFVFVDLPPQKRVQIQDGSYQLQLLKGKVTHLPKFNKYVFPALPDKSFTVKAAICYRTSHYYAYVLRAGQWYKLDCLQQPNICEVGGLPTGLNEVCVLMLEKN
jgi:hypothetical protein